MARFPFLTQFKRLRISLHSEAALEMKYDEKLDRNIFNQHSAYTNVQTHTRVQGEQPDEIHNEVTELYLKTKSYTETKTEQPDEIDDVFLYDHLATQTFTKVKSEADDQDFN